MRYYVTGNVEIFESENYRIITVAESLAILNPMRIVGIDTETRGFDVFTKELLTVQLGDINNQIMIDCATIDIQLYKEFIESDRLFLFWNAKFDLKFLYHQRIVPKNIWDGYLAEKLLYLGYSAGTRRMGLKDAALNYLNIELDKTVRGEILYKGITERVIIYGCNDVKYLESIRAYQLLELEKKELLSALSIENEFVKVLAYIEYSGIKLDEGKWRAKMAKDQAKLDEAIAAINNWIITYSEEDHYLKRFVTIDMQGDLFEGFHVDPVCTINWNSSPQLIPLFEHLGYNLKTKDKKTGMIKKSVEAKVLEIQKDVCSILEPYLEYTRCAKLVSTYGQSYLDQINPVTGRIHTNFSQLMDTGRLSCGGKDKSNNLEYVNIQNLPADEDTRSSFIPNEGYTLIDCDYTAQEDYIFTELSQEPKLIEFYNDTTRKRDGHSFVAKICFPEELRDIPEEEVKHKRPDLRSLAKKAKFAIHYGGNGDTIARNLSLPKEQGYAIEKSYLSGFSNIDAYFKRVKKDMWDKGYILINAMTGHKMFIQNWEELKEEQSNFTQDFWREYREIKEQWMAEGSDVNDKPSVMQRVSKFFKTRSGFERNSLNAPVQGSAAIITKIAGIRYFNHLIATNRLFIVWIPNCVHDEYLTEVPDELVQEEADALQAAMEDSGAIFCKSVKLKAVPEWGDHWKH